MTEIKGILEGKMEKCDGQDYRNMDIKRRMQGIKDKTIEEWRRRRLMAARELV